jgi:anti-sigma factor RsiW
MSDHPTPDALHRYRAGDLPPGELFAVDAHLEGCADCRAQGLAATTPVTALRAALVSTSAGHLDYDRIEAYVDGVLAADEREAVESHLGGCQMCSDDVGDLRRVRVELSIAADAAPAEAAASSPWLSWARVLAGMSAVGAAAAIAWLMMPAPNPAPDTDGLVADTTSAPPRVELRDGTLRLAIDADGRLGGLPADVPDAARAEAELALAGALTPSPALDGLQGAAGALMGGPTEATGFAPLSPVATVVESDRPRFRWAAHPGASRYEVAVYDARFEEVARSEAVTGTEWSAPRPLPRGVSLSWQITATTAGGTVQAPVPPAPEARFRVVDPVALARLDEVRRVAAGSHLLLAVAYNRAGLLEAMNAELDALARENQGSASVAALAASLRTRRP